MGYSISLQLYTLREETEKDFIGTLEKVAEIGYQGVEFFHYGGLTAAELKAQLDRLGLKASGSHIAIDQLMTNLDAVIDYNIQIGSSYIILPWTNYENKEEYIELARICNEIGKKCKEKGIQFCYHNHRQEFKVIDGEYALDILFNLTDPELVQAEIDVYFLKYIGLDPAEYIKKYTGRCPLIHIKDIENDEEHSFTEVGNGILDVEGIAAVAEEIGTKWLIVEQNKFKRSPFESVEISFNNIKNMGLVGGV